MTTDVTIIIPDSNDTHYSKYEIYLHDNTGEILAAIYRASGKLDIIQFKITEEIANRLFSEFRRELKIDSIL